ncbi:hypothetical protein BH11BAC7_BH11BAC7_21940 [soil metagenome]
MKTVIIDANSDSTAKLLLDLAKKMGLSAKIQKTEKIKWTIMPEEDTELEARVQKAKEDFAKGKGLSTNEVRKIIRSWK